jgi:hypothetical protein
VSSRVPPSNKPPTNQAAAQAQRARRSTRPQAADSKPKPIKMGSQTNSDEAMSPEAALWSGQDVEGRMAELNHAEEAEKEAGAEHLAETHEAAEKEAHGGKGLFKIFSWQKAQAKPQTPDPRALLKQPQAQQQQGTGKLPAFRPPGQGTATSTSASRLPQINTAPSTSAQRLQAVKMLGGQSANNERPPDAFALLKEARDKGVLFVEDALQEGHSEDREDPEHAAAVEECIRLCFGMRGILRIGPGHNDKAEPIIVVATTNGFSDASLALVPEKVHRFATLIAIPFDLLPLKRER